jgi:hypothetical protein
MKNKLTARLLNTILDSKNWNQGDLSQRSGIDRRGISSQLGGRRDIRDHHLVAYMGALDPHERAALLSAWLQDHMPGEILRDVLRLPERRVAEQVAVWSPGLSDEHRKMFAWWVHHILRDPETREIFERVTRKSGYPKLWA